jgi:hypothetical protein
MTVFPPNQTDDKTCGPRARSRIGAAAGTWVAVLPRGFRRGAELFDAKVSHSRVEGPAKDGVAVANQTDDLGIGADRLDDLLGARFAMYLATVSLLTSWPSLASSFAIRRRRLTARFGC